MYYIRVNVLLVLLLITRFSFAQNETQQRVLGPNLLLECRPSGYQMIDNISYYIGDRKEYNSVAYTDSPANSICDSTGKLLLYFDGFNVYNSRREIIFQGEINSHCFSHSYAQSVLIPIEETNRRYFYLLDVTPYIENWDFLSDNPKPNFIYNGSFFTGSKFWDICQLKVTLIDTEYNNGRGRVVYKNKIVLDSIAPTISAVKHKNNIDTWVSVLKYDTNENINLLIDPCGINKMVINQLPDFNLKDTSKYNSYVFLYGIGFQFVYSPDGTKISYTGIDSTKNRYIKIAHFDNATGLIDYSATSTKYTNACLLNNLFSIDNRFLYFYKYEFINAREAINQYDTLLDTTIVMIKGFIQNTPFHLGMDYGKQNDIINFNIIRTQTPQNGSLNRFVNIDQPYTIQNYDSILPNTSFTWNKYVNNTFINRNNYIYNFYHPDYQRPRGYSTPQTNILTLDSIFCTYDSIPLMGNKAPYIDSSHFRIQSSNLVWSAPHQNDKKIKLAPGRYTLAYITYFYCISDTAFKSIVVEDTLVSPLNYDSIYTCEFKSIPLPHVNVSPKWQWYTTSGHQVQSTSGSEPTYILKTSNTCGVFSDTITVVSTSIQVTNLVSLNQDGKNECMNIVPSTPIQQLSMEIYSSWGARIYQSTHPILDWCPNASVTPGVYYYSIRYQQDCFATGWVQVVR